MTYRAKPVVRSRRSTWESPERRNLLLNLGFGLVVLLAVVLLIVAAGLTWYNDHLAPVARVNGQAITQDDFSRRVDVENVRLELAESRVLDEFNAGRITQSQRDSQIQFIGQRRQQLASIALERLIDIRIQAALAAEAGVVVSEADVDARLAEEGTRPEQRRAWVIESAPEIAEGAEEPTAAARAEARTTADEALADLEGGTAWEEVAAERSTDSSAQIGGDLGWITDDFDIDPVFVEALFGLTTDGHSAVLEGEDGTFRIGRVTEIAPEMVEPDYRRLVADRGVPTDQYLTAVRDDVVGEKLRESIEGQALAPGPQREVAEIFLENAGLPDELPAGSVKTRHILYAPGDDPEGAAELPPEDQGWQTAEDEARAAHSALVADIDGFDALAREDSDEQSAAITGGKLPWFDPSQTQAQGGQLDDDFGAAIFQEGLQPGQLLDPVRSAFGWHVIQITYFPTDLDQANRLKADLEAGGDLATIARDYSYAPESAEGGTLGWVARFQVDQRSEAAIFATPVGSITDPVVVDGDGVHLYKILAEETRTPEGEQKSTLEQGAFSNWYAARKEAYDISREVDFSATG